MSRIRGRLSMMLSALVVSSAALALPAGAAADTVTFDHTGAAQTWTVPAGVTSATFDVYGAGGDAFTNATPSSGGRATVTIPVTPRAEIGVNVGGSGFNGGFNGGGGGGRWLGGGASDVRVGGSALADRAIVAGGGGGGTSNCTAPNTPAGGGGGLNGGNGLFSPVCNSLFGALPGTGGSQTQGGTNSGDAGAAGSLGFGGTTQDGGGGGGGYYGGAGGSNTGGGGGGSGFGPADTRFETGTHPGDGLIVISFTPEYDLGVSLSGTGTGRVSSSPTGIDCQSGSGSGCTARLAKGQITLSANPGSGSTFTGWSGAGCSGTAECIVTLNAATTVDATFAADPVPPDPPAPDIKIIGLERDRAKGTATLTVATNLGGALRVNETNKVKPAGPVDLAEAGSAELQVIPRNGAAETLRRTGRVTVNPQILFSAASGGEIGTRHKFDLRLD